MRKLWYGFMHSCWRRRIKTLKGDIKTRWGSGRWRCARLGTTGATNRIIRSTLWERISIPKRIIRRWWSRLSQSRATRCNHKTDAGLSWRFWSTWRNWWPSSTRWICASRWECWHLCSRRALRCHYIEAITRGHLRAARWRDSSRVRGRCWCCCISLRKSCNKTSLLAWRRNNPSQTTRASHSVRCWKTTL